MYQSISRLSIPRCFLNKWPTLVSIYHEYNEKKFPLHKPFVLVGAGSTPLGETGQWGGLGQFASEADLSSDNSLTLSTLQSSIYIPIARYFFVIILCYGEFGNWKGGKVDIRKATTKVGAFPRGWEWAFLGSSVWDHYVNLYLHSRFGGPQNMGSQGWSTMILGHYVVVVGHPYGIYNTWNCAYGWAQ
jgi:hypothetical protein